jgi:hypothetical protein
MRCNQRTPSGVATNAANVSGTPSSELARRQSCNVLRATPSSSATTRWDFPAAKRSSAAPSFSARTMRSRRITIFSLTAYHTLAGSPHLG